MIGGRALWPCGVTFRPILTLVRAHTDAALSCLRVWPSTPVRHTVTCYGRWPDRLVRSGLLLCLESPLMFW
jgi:hypothetical protein